LPDQSDEGDDCHDGRNDDPNKGHPHPDHHEVAFLLSNADDQQDWNYEVQKGHNDWHPAGVVMALYGCIGRIGKQKYISHQWENGNDHGASPEGAATAALPDDTLLFGHPDEEL